MPSRTVPILLFVIGALASCGRQESISLGTTSALGGPGSGCVVTVTPSPIHVCTTAPEYYATTPVSIRNHGDLDCNIIGASHTGSLQVGITLVFNTELPAGSETVFPAFYHAISTGTVSSQLTLVLDEAPPITVELHGGPCGAPVPTSTLVPGCVPVPDPPRLDLCAGPGEPASGDVKLWNRGDTTCRLTNATRDGSRDLSLVVPFGIEIAPGSAINLAAMYVPSSAAPHVATQHLFFDRAPPIDYVMTGTVCP